jgi:CDP-diacylglycerol--glycerol-3-phosphate 3-phosphatidyltransferase
MVTTCQAEAPGKGTPVLNLPNLLTVSRLLLAAVFFVLADLGWFLLGFLLFVIAASTDALDGYLARRRGETTTLGRILDPFVDKVIVIGAFVFLLPIPDAGLAAWMVTLIVARELLVTGLRSYLEGESIAFGADWAGKLKMILQCGAIGLVLLHLALIRHAVSVLPPAWSAALPGWLGWLSTVAVWLAVAATALSGISYAWRARRLVSQRHLD